MRNLIFGAPINDFSMGLILCARILYYEHGLNILYGNLNYVREDDIMGTDLIL